ncbi:MAG: UbiA family prenyltransferase [Puniceicoccaceae bacterium]
MSNRWWIYQRERFPLVRHGVLVLAFSLSALTFSRLLRGEVSFPPWSGAFVAFATALTFFLQLRIADEFKDIDEDTRYRPYRAVPRGLVSLRELGRVFVLCAAGQLLLALWLHPPLIVLLLVTWVYLAGMCKEFFAREWLKARPLVYLWSHMLIMPLVDLYMTSCDWLVHGLDRPPTGILWFLVVSFCNGVLLEFGRKIRCAGDEEAGVETYTALWGTDRAVTAWVLALSVNLGAALMASVQTETFPPTVVVLSVFYAAAVAVAVAFRRNPTGKRAGRIEAVSGIWTLAMYLVLGPLALVWHQL